MARKINVVDEKAEVKVNNSSENFVASALSEDEYRSRVLLAREKAKKDNIKKLIRDIILYIVLTAIAAVYMIPVIVIIINSFKGNLYVSDAPFELPDDITFVGFDKV